MEETKVPPADSDEQQPEGADLATEFNKQMTELREVLEEHMTLLSEAGHAAAGGQKPPPEVAILSDVDVTRQLPLAVANGQEPSTRAATENAWEVASIDKALATLSAAEKQLKERRAAVVAVLTQQFSAAGAQSIKLRERLVFLHRSVFAEPLEGVGPAEMIAALDACGLGAELAPRKVNKQGLDALAREWRDEQTGELEIKPPTGLDLVLKVGEVWSIRTKKA